MSIAKVQVEIDTRTVEVWAQRLDNAKYVVGEVGAAVKEVRALWNLSQNTVSDETGINTYRLGRIERGQEPPTMEEAAQLCEWILHRATPIVAGSDERVVE